MQRAREFLRDILRQTDLVLLALCCAATAYGILMIYSATRYMNSMREVLVQTGGAVIGIVLFFLLFKAMVGLWNAAALGKINWGLFAAGAFVGILALGILSLLFPLLSRFENTTAMQLKNTLLLGLANLPRTLGLGLIQGAAIYLCARFVFPLFFLPALAALLSSFLVEPIFRPFLPEEPVTSPAEE